MISWFFSQTSLSLSPFILTLLGLGEIKYSLGQVEEPALHSAVFSLPILSFGIVFGGIFVVYSASSSPFFIMNWCFAHRHEEELVWCMRLSLCSLVCILVQVQHDVCIYDMEGNFNDSIFSTIIPMMRPLCTAKILPTLRHFGTQMMYVMSTSPKAVDYAWVSLFRCHLFQSLSWGLLGAVQHFWRWIPKTRIGWVVTSPLPCEHELVFTDDPVEQAYQDQLKWAILPGRFWWSREDICEIKWL